MGDRRKDRLILLLVLKDINLYRMQENDADCV